MTKINQLHEFFAPENYKLRLEVDREKRKFQGRESIFGRKIGTKNVRLHAKNLEIISAKIGGDPATWKARANDEIEFFAEKNPASGGTLTIELEYSGTLRENEMHGLYICKYRDAGAEKELLATQFESHSFREAFVGVDEPDAKATFDLTLVTEAGITVLANTPALNAQKIGENRLETTFATTPKMSSYLLAFVAGELQKVSQKTRRGVAVSAYSTKAQPLGSLEIAVDAAAKLIDFYENYFGAKYPLAKSDHVALPDFAAGAMENWGLVTYRETALLADENSSRASQHYVVEVIAHELSHQWFGDLVTMKWWNDLWLNESFASLMETFSLDELWPDWKMWQNSATANSLTPLRRDAIPGVQAVRQSVNSPDEIGTLFDPAIVYAKGERLLTMLRETVGRENFRRGLEKYFAKFAYQNTEARDLWGEITEAAGIDVAALMNPWLEQPGFPVVEIREISGAENLPTEAKNLVLAAKNRGEKGPLILLHQSRFSLVDTPKSAQIWPIPLFANDPAAPKIFDTEYAIFAPKNDPRALELNVGNFAHFVTAGLEKISHEKFAKSAEIDRAKIVQERVLLNESAGEFSRKADELVDLLEAARGEKSALVWGGLAIAIDKLKWLAETDGGATENLQEIVAENTHELFGGLGARTRKSDSENDVKLRSIIFARKIWSEDREISERPAIDAALKIFEKNRDDLAKIDGNVRAIVLGAAVKFGAEFDFLLDIYKTSSRAELKLDLCSALTETRDPDQIDELIALLTRPEIVRPQDLFYWFLWLAKNRFARAKIWRWTRENWPFIVRVFGGDNSFSDFPKYLGRALETPDELREFREFFDEIVAGEPGISRDVKMAETEIAARISQISRDRTAVIARLESSAKK